MAFLGWAAISLCLIALVDSQAIKTINGSFVFEVAGGASLTLAGTPSCASSSQSGSDNSLGVVYQQNLQTALANAIINATNQQITSVVSSVNSMAIVTSSFSAAQAQLAQSVDQRFNASLTAMGALVGTSLTAQIQSIVPPLVQSESSRAISVENSINAGLLVENSKLRSQLIIETSRATAAETLLALNVTSISSYSLNTNALVLSETARALSAEVQLSSGTAATVAMSASTMKAYIDSSLATQVSSLSATIAATAASLAGSIAGVSASVTSSATVLSANLATEVSRASASERSVAAISNVETSRAVLAEGLISSSLSTAIVSETSRATSAVTALYNNISLTLSRYTSINYNALPTVSGTLWSWHDASDPNGNFNAPATAFSVTTWYDKGPNALHLNTRTGTAATDVGYIPSSKNGRGAVFFNGGSYLSSSKQSVSFGGGIGVTWFIVYRTSADTVSRGIATVNPEPSPWCNWWTSTGGNSERWEMGNTPQANTFSTTSTPVLTLNTWMVSVGRAGSVAPYTFTHMNSAGQRYIGSQVAPDIQVISQSNRGLILGYYATSNFNSYIAESIVYNSYLSDSDQALVFNWLRGKWGI